MYNILDFFLKKFCGSEKGPFIRRYDCLGLWLLAWKAVSASVVSTKKC